MSEVIEDNSGQIQKIGSGFFWRSYKLIKATDTSAPCSQCDFFKDLKCHFPMDPYRKMNMIKIDSDNPPKKMCCTWQGYEHGWINVYYHYNGTNLD